MIGLSLTSLLTLQENYPLGTSVLELIMSDRDSLENGPPYTFQITEGNEGKAFQINQDGWLVTSAILNRKAKGQYLLQIQVDRSSSLTAQSYWAHTLVEKGFHQHTLLMTVTNSSLAVHRVVHWRKGMLPQHAGRRPADTVTMVGEVGQGEVGMRVELRRAKWGGTGAGGPGRGQVR